ncbi:glycosyltransferase [Sphingomonas beigongshangi]|uniref:glycosyltransferase n=1 Tax=Sphingomonas beigongshangi TaxID=2782540 RepID=UPI00193C031D
MTDTPVVSLLVCTRDRVLSLPRLLSSITRAAAHPEAPRIEVVLVDNGSADGTADCLARWAADQPFAVRLIKAERAGLAHARNAGLPHARGAILAMTDDDCRLHTDYFAALVSCFSALQAPAIVGGRILPGDPADLPLTIKLEDHPMVAAPHRFPGGFAMGANLAMTGDVPGRVGPFDARFGAGTPFRAAEDTDYLVRAQAAGVAIRYDPRFVVDHHHGRRLPAEERSLLAGYGIGDGALYAKFLFKDPRVLRFLLGDLAALPRDVFAPIRTHASVRAFHFFRLRCKIRGMAIYAWVAARAAAQRRTRGHGRNVSVPSAPVDRRPATRR